MFMMPMAIMLIEDENDRDFIQRLFLQNEFAMFGMALRIVKDHHTASDMVSASCLKMIEKIDYLRKIPVCKQTPYIISIVRNTSLMYLRKRRSENSWLVDDERVLDWAAKTSKPVDENILVEAEAEELREAIRRLNARERDLLVMKYFEQRTDEEISSVLGIGKDSVRFYLTKARRALGDELRKGE